MEILAIEQAGEAIFDSEYVNLCWDTIFADCEQWTQHIVNTMKYM